MTGLSSLALSVAHSCLHKSKMEEEQATSSRSLAETKVEVKRSLVVIMVGPPGSGKSTFCEAVLGSAKRSWVRVCQDTISNGKAGSKAQCLKSATEALNTGRNVFIDRCNLEKSQRSEFVKLGGPHVEVHAVALDLPAKLCISRSVARLGHEGKLQGSRAAVVVNKMLQSKEDPSLNEGFSRINFCYNDNDVNEVLKVYKELGEFDNLSSGVFGQKSKDKIVQSNIMKFFRKSNSNSVDNIEKEKEKEGKSELSENSSKLDESQIHTLAFPSISTSDFQFDLDKASDIIIDSVCEFLKKVDNDIRLVLVDLSEKSRIISLIKSKAEKKGIDSRRFFTFVGDITQLYSKGGLKCTAIANASNWRLKPGGGGVNAAIYKAAGNEILDSATKQIAETLNPGNSIPVLLPSTSPLYRREKITHVIHVLGPNMNPQRPNYLRNDYVKGCEILKNAYNSMFENFESVVKKIESGELGDFEKNKKQKVSNLENLGNSNVELEKNEKIEEIKTRNWGSWALALYNIAMNPEKYKNIILELSNDFLVLNDLYPKAKKHVLVLSRTSGLDCLEDSKREHIPLLKSMHLAGIKWAQNFINEDPSLSFRLGYHSDPSMRQLHLHVISQDFESSCLKNKKHWNSFNSSFFKDSADVIEEVEKNGCVELNGQEEKLLAMELRCHKCKSAHPNIPKLKLHIANCRSPFPSNLVGNGRIISILSGNGESS